MKLTTRLSALLVGFAAMASAAWAGVPFKATTITDGQFAADTEWYTLEIGASKLRISDNADKGYIQLGGLMTGADANLWCFVGDDTNGYKIYNKQAGATKALAAPTTMSDGEGKTSYAYLQTVDGLATTQTNLWDFAEATKTSANKDLSITGGFYINEHGITANRLNNRDGKLAFWSGGYDNGSVFTIVKASERTFVTPEPQTDLLITTGQPNYRIPAIARAHNGDLIAVADYRFTGSDIGYGRLDLHSKISKDNGVTWSENPIEVVRGIDYVKGSPTAEHPSSAFLHTGFGDPCIVADRESDRVLLMSCSGDVMFYNGTRSYHQGIARFYSEDNGQTWSAPVDISESIYSQFDTCTIGTAKSMFVGSGRIFQSSTVKVGNYYRLYCSVLFKDVNNVNKNYVLYSDDFGGNWLVLGGVNVAPIPSGADEPKAEELPDGSVLCSSRINGGRMYNIFHFTNSAKAEGYWDNVATSNSSNNGVAAEGNSCNGEVMVIPAQRKADGKDVFLILQSVPFGPSGRNNVGIYYKELASLSDFSTPAVLAKNWTGRHQSSYMGSAYSTMTLQKDNTIGFLYEESTYGVDYTIVYKNYSIEQITDSAYTFKADADRNAIVRNGIDAKLESVSAKVGVNVGNYKESSVDVAATAIEAYKAAPSVAAYEAINAAFQSLSKVKIHAGGRYRLRNAERSKDNAPLYMIAQSDVVAAAALDEGNEAEIFEFRPTDDANVWKVYNEANNVYIGRTQADETNTPVITADTYSYKIVSGADGRSSLSCTDPTNSSHPALHLAGDCARIVPWGSGAAASLWYIEPADVATDIAAAEVAQTNTAKLEMYDIQGRKLAGKPMHGLYITSDRKKHLAR